MLDSVVKVAFDGNDVVLAQWRIARRVRGLPGGGSTATSALELTPETNPVAA